MTRIYTLEEPLTKEIRYIGKTSQDLKKRLARHIHDSKINKSKTHKEAWISSLLKRGLVPRIEELDIVKEEEWKFWERHYISLFRSFGFRLTNLSGGGDGFEKGHKPWHTGTKGVMKAWNKGKKLDKPVRPPGWKPTEKQKRRMSEAAKRRGNNKPTKPIVQLSLNEEEIQRFESAREAQRITGIPQGNIWRVLEGERKTAGNYKWKYQ